MRISKSLRTGLAAAAAVTAATALLLSAPASATERSPARTSTIESTQSDPRATCPDRDTRGEWRSWCLRRPVDGDDGGVSGTARREWSGSPEDRFAQIRFEALDERIKISNYTTAKATFKAWKDGDRFFHETLAAQAGAWTPYDHGLREGQTVTIQVCVHGGRGCATQTNLRT
jgi:hypothetical protein